jgi:hypothetical protein
MKDNTSPSEPGLPPSSGASERFLAAMRAAPHMREWYLEGFYKRVFFEGQLPVRLKELVRLRLSLLHGCAT